MDELSEFLETSSHADNESTLECLCEDFRDQPVTVLVATQQTAEESKPHKKLIGEGRFTYFIMLQQDFEKIVIKRLVKKIERMNEVDNYWTYYKEKFTWINGVALERFRELFPVHPESINMASKITSQLTTKRAGIVFLHRACKNAFQLPGLITPDKLFDSLEGRPEGKNYLEGNFSNAYSKYGICRESFPHFSDKVEIVEKILKTLVLYNLAEEETISIEQIADAVMDDYYPSFGIEQNLAFYKTLLNKMAIQMRFVKAVNGKFAFDPEKELISIEADKQQAIKECDENCRTETIKRGMKHDTCEFNEIQFDAAVKVQTYWKNCQIKGWFQGCDPKDETFKLRIVDPLSDDHDFKLYLAVRHGDIDKRILKTVGPRTIFWIPRQLMDDEILTVQTCAALDSLKERYAERVSKGDEEKLKLAEHERQRLERDLQKVIKDIYAGGIIFTSKLPDIGFEFSAFSNLLEQIVSQVLTSIYPKNPLVFKDDKPWQDSYARNILNGIIRLGKIDKDSGSRSVIDAADNFAVGLGIAKDVNPRILDLEGSETTGRMLSLFDDSKEEIDYKELLSVLRVGDYGIPARIVSILVFALVKKGKINAFMKPNLVDGDILNYSNISSTDFVTKHCDSILKIAKTRIPSSWREIVQISSLFLEQELIDDETPDNIYGIYSNLKNKLASLQATFSIKKEQANSFFTAIQVEDCLTPIFNDLQEITSIELTGAQNKDLETFHGIITDKFGNKETLKEQFTKVRSAVVFLNDRKDEVKAIHTYFTDIPDSYSSLKQLQEKVKQKFIFPELAFDVKYYIDLQDAYKKYLEAYRTKYNNSHRIYWEKNRAFNASCQKLVHDDIMGLIELLERIDVNQTSDSKQLRQEIMKHVTKTCEAQTLKLLEKKSVCSCSYKMGEEYKSPIDLADYKKRLENTLRSLLSSTQEKLQEIKGKDEGVDEFISLDPSAKKQELRIISTDLVTRINRLLKEANITVLQIDMAGLNVYDAKYRASEIRELYKAVNEAIASEMKTRIRRLHKETGKTVDKQHVIIELVNQREE
jgi:hypothetical protein